MPAKDSRILSVKAKNKTYTKLVQGLLRLRILRVLVLCQNLVVQHTHNLTGLDTDVELFLQVDIGIIDQEAEARVFLFKVCQLDNLRGIVGALHVVNLKGGEIAGNNPAGVL